MAYPVKTFKLAVGSTNVEKFQQLPTPFRLLIELLRRMRQQGRIVLRAQTYTDFDMSYKLFIKGAFCTARYVGSRAVNNAMLRRTVRQCNK